jgi:hypothetical protein
LNTPFNQGWDPTASSGAAPQGVHQWRGILVSLLPYMEAQPVYDRYTLTLKTGLDQYDKHFSSDLNSWNAAHTKIGDFLCPTLPNMQPDGLMIHGIAGRLEDAGSGKVNINLMGSYFNPPDFDLGLTHYQACAGLFGHVGDGWSVYGTTGPPVDRHLIGIYSCRSRTNTAKVADGLSKTLAFGEAPGTFGTGVTGPLGPTGEFAFGVPWSGSATLPTGFGLNVSEQNTGGTTYRTHWCYFSSMHSGGVQFAYGDGSVHMLPTSIDEAIYDALSTINYAETVDTGQY